MKCALIFIGTNRYAGFFEGYKSSIDLNFLPDHEKTYFVFTDQPAHPLFKHNDVVVTKIEHESWPYVTLHRFKYMMMVKDKLAEYDYVFFVDADLWACQQITDAHLLDHEKPLIGVQHPGFFGKIGTFETNTKSRANIFDGHYNLLHYRQGCFWGGKSFELLKLVEELEKRIDLDLQDDVVAIWHDESHLNKYMLENNHDVFTLHPGFAQPQDEGYENIREMFPTMMVHLKKDLKEFPRFEGIK
jgi:hypothetical protein